MDASPEVRWLAERSAAAGYAVVVVSALFGCWRATHMLSNAHQNRGGRVLCWWQRRRQKGKFMWNDWVSSGWWRQQIFGTMRKAAKETREDKIGHIGKEIVNYVRLGGTPTAASMAPSPSLTEERPTNNRPAHNIGRGIKTMEKASKLDYRT